MKVFFAILMMCSTAWATPTVYSGITLTGSTATVSSPSASITMTAGGSMVWFLWYPGNIGFTHTVTSIAGSGAGCPAPSQPWQVTNGYNLESAFSWIFYNTPAGTCTPSATIDSSNELGLICIFIPASDGVIPQYALDVSPVPTGNSCCSSTASIATDNSSDMILSFWGNGCANLASSTGTGFTQLGGLITDTVGTQTFMSMLVSVGNFGPGTAISSYGYSCNVGPNGFTGGVIQLIALRRAMPPPLSLLQTNCSAPTGGPASISLPDPFLAHDTAAIDLNADSANDVSNNFNPVVSDGSANTPTVAPIGWRGEASVGIFRYLYLFHDETAGAKTFTLNASGGSQTYPNCVSEFYGGGSRLYTFSAIQQGGSGTSIPSGNLPLPAGTYLLYSSLSDDQNTPNATYAGSTGWFRRYEDWRGPYLFNLETMHGVWSQNAVTVGSPTSFHNNVTASTGVGDAFASVVAFALSPNPLAHVRQVAMGGGALSSSSPFFQTAIPVNAGDVAHVCLTQTAPGVATLTNTVASTVTLLDGGTGTDVGAQWEIQYTASGLDTVQIHNDSGNNASVLFRDLTNVVNLDAHNMNEGTGTAITDGGITTTQNNEYISSCGGTSIQQTLASTGANYVFRAGAGSHQTLTYGFEYEGAPAGAQTNPYTTPGSAAWMGAIAAFGSTTPATTKQPVVNLITMDQRTMDRLTAEVLGYE